MLLYPFTPYICVSIYNRIYIFYVAELMQSVSHWPISCIFITLRSLLRIFITKHTIPVPLKVYFIIILENKKYLKIKMPLSLQRYILADQQLHMLFTYCQQQGPWHWRGKT